MKWEDVRDYLTMFLVGVTAIAFIYVIANNETHKHLWIEKCKDGGGITVTTPQGYICVNPTAVIEVE
jgi:hypothetical protein